MSCGLEVCEWEEASPSETGRHFPPEVEREARAMIQNWSLEVLPFGARWEDFTASGVPFGVEPT